MGTETTEAAAALSGGGCEIDIEVVRSGFAHWRSGLWVPGGALLRCMGVPWAGILPSVVGSIPNAPEQGQPSGLAPGPDRALVTPAVSM